MTEPRPSRPRTLFERSWPWLTIAGALAGGVTVGALALLRSIQRAVHATGDASFWLIAGVGLVALALMGSVGFYAARKRSRALQERMPGSMMAWLRSHVYLGLLALAVAVVHAWLYPVSSRLTTGKVALGLLTLLVLSGVAWRLVYRTVPGRVARRVGNLSTDDTRERLQQIDVEIAKLVAGASGALRDAVQARLSGTYDMAALERSLAAIEPGERARWEELRALAARRDRYVGREPVQRRYQRLLQGWKLAHVPLAVALGVAIAVHLLDVFGVSLGRPAAARFPSSAECADCHSEIARQWLLSVHSVAQDSPVTVAQTALALKKDPSIRQLCTNCHAPIGTALSPSNIFPLPGERHGDQILSEGISCIACHTLRDRPGEGRGAADRFPVTPAGARSFGTMFGPALRDPPPLPVPDHGFAAGKLFSGRDKLSPDQAASFLCAACHDVKVDLDRNGFSPFRFRDDDGKDTDGDGILDENELRAVRIRGDVDGSDLIADLVLQTTFDEWEDYMAQAGTSGLGCAECHMPPSKGPLVDDAPGGLGLPARTIHGHTFVGVDYDLRPGHYSRLGVGASDAFEGVLAERDRLLKQAAALDVDVVEVTGGRLTAQVSVRAGNVGHDFPTGFAFARQVWLEVSATTSSGKAVCLARDPNGIASPCRSGALRSPADDLRPCDPTDVARRFDTELNTSVRLIQRFPVGKCDPWLTNYQKILTDGDPDRNGTFAEVPYQSLQPDIVKLGVRVADQQVMAPLKPFEVRVLPGSETIDTFAYDFDVGKLRAGERVTVRAVLHFRHLPPYFLRALDGFYPDGLTSAALLQGMRVSDMASAESARARVP